MTVRCRNERFTVEVYDPALRPRKRWIGTFATYEEAKRAEAIAQDKDLLDRPFSEWPREALAPSRAWQGDMPPITRLVLLALREAQTIDFARIAALCRIAETEAKQAIVWLSYNDYITAPTVEWRRYIPEVIRQRIFERDEATCRHCGAQEDLAIDHIRPVSCGGTNADDNLQVLCRSCNSRKGARWEIEELDPGGSDRRQT